MKVELSIPNIDGAGRIFLTWTPIQATARLIDGPGAGQSVPVTVRSAGPVGQVVFDVVRSHNGQSTLALNLPGDGTPVRFWVAGEFKKPSVSFGDAVIKVVDATNAELNSTPLMVRIRKDANTLSATERDRFLSAFGTLNGQGTGRFTDFRDMHTGPTLGESHGDWGFLPWHRAYLLDLERQLQNIDPEVALPYWRFDAPAPNLFTQQFVGLPDANDRVRFVAGHPFQTWVTEGQVGIVRRSGFPPANKPPGLKNEAATLALGQGAFDVFGEPYTGQAVGGGLEADPHGRAHTSFRFGWITAPATAPRDPVFFLLHGNVDRLWAKWQWFYKRHTASDAKAFHQGSSSPPGHNLDDTMWPWNGITGDPRPDTAPGGAMVASELTSAPGSSPVVRSMVDYQAVTGGAHLGFDYDDVPFEYDGPAIA
jgi:tyrosinase